MASGFECINGKVVGHSGRGHAANMARNSGISNQQVMEAAGWRSGSVFRDHYYSPKFVPEFGRKV